MAIKSILKEILELVLIFIIAVIIIMPIRFFLVSPFIVNGASMEPTFSHTDYLIVEKISSDFKRGDVIVIEKGGVHFLKRIIGLPGETIKIEGGRVIITKNNQKHTLREEFIKEDISQDFKDVAIGKNEFFVMGDNRKHSHDSRNWGPIRKEQISGIVLLRLFPFTEIKLFNFEDSTLENPN